MYKNHRYNPFKRSRQPGHQSSSIAQAYEEYRRLNRNEGRLITWDHGIAQGWIEVPRPQRPLASGRAVDIAASGFKNIWPKDASPFFCPHTKGVNQKFKPLVLRLGGTLEGLTQDYFAAQDHVCDFKIVVTPLKEREYLTSWEDRRRFQGEHGDQDEVESDSPQHLSSSPISAFPSPSRSSPSSFESDDCISALAAEAQVNPDPRYGQRRQQISPPKSTYAASGTALESPPSPPKSFFTQSVAEARKLCDMDLMDYTQAIHMSGVAQDDPASHPAWDNNNPHKVLQVYDQRLYPHCLRRTFEHLQLMYQPIGQVIRDLCSTYGVPHKAWTTMLKNTCLCKGCGTHFSAAGYNAHIQQGLCLNHPDLVPVTECVEATLKMPFRTFREGKRPGSCKELLDSPIGAALLEWNSRIGVPADVWTVTSTAVVCCKLCDLVRIFPAHVEHLDNGVCRDPGQSVWAQGGDEIP